MAERCLEESLEGEVNGEGSHVQVGRSCEVGGRVEWSVIRY